MRKVKQYHYEPLDDEEQDFVDNVWDLLTNLIDWDASAKLQAQVSGLSDMTISRLKASIESNKREWRGLPRLVSLYRILRANGKRLIIDAE